MVPLQVLPRPMDPVSHYIMKWFWLLGHISPNHFSNYRNTQDSTGRSGSHCPNHSSSLGGCDENWALGWVYIHGVYVESTWIKPYDRDGPPARPVRPGQTSECPRRTPTPPMHPKRRLQCVASLAFRPRCDTRIDQHNNALRPTRSGHAVAEADAA